MGQQREVRAVTRRQGVQTDAAAPPAVESSVRAPAGPVRRTASRGRRERERQAMRERLLAAARQIAAEEGWQAVTIRRIADRLEYASPILYQHFPSKDALLLELVNVGFREVTQTLQAARQAPPDRVLKTLALAYWRFAFSAPELYQAMHGLDGVPFGTAATPSEAQEAFRVVRAALLRLAAASHRELSDPDGAVDTIWACLHGFVSLTMSGRIAGGPARAKALLLRGLPPLFDSLLR
jgi:AcrR family transcriptional regulator